MIFEGQYLTFNEYESLGGTLKNETPFNLLEIEARNQIDLRTQNRLVDVDEIPQKVKICMFHLMEKILSYNKTTDKISKGNVASESTDGYSVTFITPEKIREIIISKASELEDIMMTDLFGVIVNNVAILFDGII